jgi:hypothetical protein
MTQRLIFAQFPTSEPAKKSNFFPRLTSFDDAILRPYGQTPKQLNDHSSK